jgi:hypothetical protein
MARHHPETPAAEADIDAAVGAALAELQRRKAYEHLLYLEKRIAAFPPVPGDPPYVETSPGFAKS